MKESRREHAHLGWRLVSDQIDLAVPPRALNYSDGANGAIDCIGGSNVIPIRRPRTPSEIRSQGGALERGADGGVEDKIVNHVMLGRIRRGRGEAEDLDGSVVAGRGEEFVGRVKGDALDVALVGGNRLELLKRVTRPDHNLGVEPDRHEQRGVVGPGQILHVVLVPNQALVRLPVLDRRRLVGAKGRGWRPLVQMVDADELVVGAAGQVAAIGREAHGMDGAQMVAHVAQLARLLVVAIVGVIDGVGGPDAHMAVAARRRDSLAVGRDVAAVDLEILLLAAVAQPRGLDDAHVGGGAGIREAVMMLVFWRW